MDGMKLEGKAVFIADPDALIREIMVLDDLGTITQAIDLIRKHALVIQATEIIPLDDLINSAIPERLIEGVGDGIKHAMAVEVLKHTGEITLSKEGVWPGE